MTLQDLANLGEAIGGIAVLITLIFLTFQIRQNTKGVLRKCSFFHLHESHQRRSVVFSFLGYVVMD